MSKEQIENQAIEEMAECCTYFWNGACTVDAAKPTDCDLMCEIFGVFANLGRAGYRKQSEVIAEFSEAVKHIAEGVKFKNDTEKTAFIEMLDDLTRVKMKGGAE